MILPTIHLNGTSREELREQISRADRAADALREALVRMAPNGRDYYPQGSNAIRLALLEHEERIAKVDQITRDLDALAEHTYEDEPWIYRMCVITYSRGRCQDHWFNLKAAGYDECVAEARRRYPLRDQLLVAGMAMKRPP